MLFFRSERENVVASGFAKVVARFDLLRMPFKAARVTLGGATHYLTCPVSMIALWAIFFASHAAAVQISPANLVNPMVGTANQGQTFPIVGVPFEMTDWTPATRVGQDKGLVPYYYSDTHFYGFRGSHYLSGSDTQDYGSVQIMMGRGTPNLKSGAPFTTFSHQDEHASPYIYSVKLSRLGIEASMTGTTRCGIVRLKFLRGGKVWVLVENFARPGAISVHPSRNEITSRSTVRRLYAGHGQLAGFSGYAYIKFNHHFQSGKSWSGRELKTVNQAETPAGVSNGAYVLFNVKRGEVIYARIGTSFTSLNEAQKNLRSEIPNWDFNMVAERAAQAWNRALSKIRVSGPLNGKRIFYTALYHTMLLPRIFSDVDGSYPEFGGGGIIEKSIKRPYYADFSVWDTFRAVHPLFTIIDPKRDSDMVQSLIDKGEQGGFLPIFPAWNSYTDEMTGDHATAIISDAWMKGITGFDINKAYALMRENAFNSPHTKQAYLDGKGRRALRSYLKYGYIPLEDHINGSFHKNEQVSRTLDYAYDDFVVSQVAESLGKSKDAAILAKRAQNYRNVIDPKTGFARGRFEDGSWITPFDPTKSATYITESTPYEFTFFVPQDIPGLIRLEGGDEAFIAKLKKLFQLHIYDQGNEPSNQIAYLYDYAGDAPEAQAEVHRIVSELYHDRPNGLPGNDDAGQMSAWYVFSALGFYPVTPGIPAYEIGTPHFRHATLHLPNGKQFEIVAHNLSPRNYYIQSALLNGKPLNKFWLTQAEIVNGGVLELEMSGRPNTNWPESDRAPSGLKVLGVIGRKATINSAP